MKSAPIATRSLLTLVLFIGLSIPHGQRAHGQETEPEISEILIIGTTPSGAGIEESKIPFPIQSANSEDLKNAVSLSLADYLNRSLTGVNLNDAQNNPLQPDVQYRGFTASPLLGLAQGLAVYQNGVRINEPLGDTVNWDLIPTPAIASITLSGGANPLFGLNSLGGALAIKMKNGFEFAGHNIEVSTGSFGRTITSIESGGNNGTLAYYANIHHFEEDGWRDHSPSDALNFFTNLGWQNESSSINLTAQHGKSDLIGNGSSPIELLEMDRKALFTGPDITENNLLMFSLDGSHEVNDEHKFSGNIFFRENDTDSVNGDSSEFSLCNIGGVNSLLEGLQEDELEELSLNNDDICNNQFATVNALEDFLNSTATQFAPLTGFDLEDLTAEISGTKLLSDQAINNISDRNQLSRGADFQWAYSGKLLDKTNQLVVGLAWFEGESRFNSVLELASFDPLTRLTTGLGTGAFVDEEATAINTVTESTSLYIRNSMEIISGLTLTLSARVNDTRVRLKDRSGEHPELNGEHRYIRINPAVGLTWQANEEVNYYVSYSESSRAPTPIELACNEGIFDLAVANAIENGEDASDVNLECRLPNAFLADPPLDQVVAKSVDLGLRGSYNNLRYQAGLFHTINTDDILFQTTGRSTGLFANVDKTRRAGFEGSINGHSKKLDWFLTYSYVDASFEDDFMALSPNHEFADENSEISISKGDRIPGIPAHLLKLGGDYFFSESLSFGVDLVHNGNQILRGDESNQLSKIDGFTVVNMRLRYHVSDKLEIFAKLENVFDKEYESFGLLGEEPQESGLAIFEDFENPRFLGAGSPRAGFIGIRYGF